MSARSSRKSTHGRVPAPRPTRRPAASVFAGCRRRTKPVKSTWPPPGPRPRPHTWSNVLSNPRSTSAAARAMRGKHRAEQACPETGGKIFRIACTTKPINVPSPGKRCGADWRSRCVVVLFGFFFLPHPILSLFPILSMFHFFSHPSLHCLHHNVRSIGTRVFSLQTIYQQALGRDP